MSIIQESSQLKKSDPNFSITFSVKPFRLYPFFVRQNSVSGFFGKIHVATAHLGPRHPHVGARVEGIDLNEISETEILKILGPALEKYGTFGTAQKKNIHQAWLGPGCFPNRCRFFFNTWHPQKFALLYLVVFFLMNQGLNLRDS